MLLKVIRWFVGRLILFFDRVFSPSSIQRSPQAQLKVDALVSGMVLYQFEACPFCVKVRRALKRMNLNVELRDTRKNPAFEKELLAGGGQLQVPCLKIAEPGAPVRWLYESDEIIQFLSERIANVA